MTSVWHRDPFASPHGGRPVFLAPRDDVEVRVKDLTGRLSASRFSRNLTISGPTGSGKTTVLNQLTEDFRRRGWLVVTISLRPRADLSMQLTKAVEQAVLTRGGRKILPKVRRWRSCKIQASAKVPFTPIEFQYSNASEQNSKPFDEDLAWTVIEQYLENKTPVIILIDEGDFLTIEEYEDVFVPLIDRTASRDLPFTVIGAGTTAKFRTAMLGESTFPAGLQTEIQLRCLGEAESRQLLVNTAKLGGQDWSSADLSDVVRLCRGIPRQLHDVGSSIFCRADDINLKQAATQFLEPLATRLRNRHSSLSPTARLIRDESMAILNPCASIGEFYSKMDISLRYRMPEEEMRRGLAECESHEILYIGPDWVEMLSPVC